MTKGRISAGIATTNSRATARTGGWSPVGRSPRLRTKTSSASPTAAIPAGSSPPVNRAEMETPVTAPTMISTRLGGIVSDMAAEAASCAASSPDAMPRRRISGSSTGATAAWSAALEPEMPEMRYIAAIST